MPTPSIPSPNLPVEELQRRLLGKRLIDPERGCWIWQGSKFKVGYGYIKICSKGWYVHRISLLAFKGLYKGYVLHTCDVKLCFNPDHLYLGTNRQNALDAVERGQIRRGEDSALAKLSEAQAIAIKALIREGRTQQEVADAFGVSSSQVSRIVNGVRWRHLSGKRGESRE